MPLQIIQQDITKMHVDAIVNAANSSLLGGGGVDGAIHRAAGPGLLKECRTLGGCPTGEAKRTKAYNLPCKYVIHTVGPVWRGGNSGEKEDLISCYENSMRLAEEAKCRSVAFPLISSGIYGYPKDKALEVAADTTSAYLRDHDLDMEVYIVVFDKSAYRIESGLYEDIRRYIDDTYSDEDGEDSSGRILRAFADEEASRPLRRLLGPSLRSVRKSKEDRAAGNSAPPVPMAAAASFAPGRSELKDLVSSLEEETFSQKLLKLIDEAGMTDAECYRRANVDRRLFSKIRSNKNYQPSKRTALAFAIALRLPLGSTKDLLERAGYALTHASKADIIVEYFIEHELFDVMRINEALFAFEQEQMSN